MDVGVQRHHRLSGPSLRLIIELSKPDNGQRYCLQFAAFFVLRPTMDHRQQFEQLSCLLIDHKAYWQFVPFAEMALPWRGELAHWLAALSDEQVAVLRQDVQATQIELAKKLPVVNKLEALSNLMPSAASPMTYPSRLDWQIPGRKWQQITQFNEALTERQTPWLEWCAGKGHLGRALAATSNQGVTSLEWQSKLCQHGQELATRFDLEMTTLRCSSAALAI